MYAHTYIIIIMWNVGVFYYKKQLSFNYVGFVKRTTKIETVEQARYVV